jgi:hypothetical protein
VCAQPCQCPARFHAAASLARTRARGRAPGPGPLLPLLAHRQTRSDPSCYSVGSGWQSLSGTGTQAADLSLAAASASGRPRPLGEFQLQVELAVHSGHWHWQQPECLSSKGRAGTQVRHAPPCHLDAAAAAAAMARTGHTIMMRAPQAAPSGSSLRAPTLRLSPLQRGTAGLF